VQAHLPLSQTLSLTPKDENIFSAGAFLKLPALTEPLLPPQLLLLLLCQLRSFSTSFTVSHVSAHRLLIHTFSSLQDTHLLWNRRE